MPQRLVARSLRTNVVAVIPKILHQIWIGPHPPPRALMQSWIDHHPGWQYRLWTERDLSEPLQNQRAFDALSAFSSKANVWRYEIIERYGGVYADADFLCLRRLDENMLHSAFFTAYESESAVSGQIANGLFGAIPHHPVSRRLVERIHRLAGTELSWRTGFDSTGPPFFSEVIREIPQGVVVHPSWLFYPDHFGHDATYERMWASEGEPYARHDWFFESPTVCLMMFAGADPDLLRISLASVRTHISCYVVAVNHPDRCSAEQVARMLRGVPGTILEGHEADSAEELVAAARGMADFTLLLETGELAVGFSRLKLTPAADGYSANRQDVTGDEVTLRLCKDPEEIYFRKGQSSGAAGSDRSGRSILEDCVFTRFESPPHGADYGQIDRSLTLADALQGIGAYRHATSLCADLHDFELAPKQRWQMQCRKGACDLAMGAAIEVVEPQLLAAFRLQPQRPEPLLTLGTHYYARGDHTNATRYFEHVAALPEPRTPLRGVERPRQQALEFLSVSAYYAGRYDLGFQAGMEALRGQPTVLPHERVRTNLEYYAAKVGRQRS